MISHEMGLEEKVGQKNKNNKLNKQQWQSNLNDIKEMKEESSLDSDDELAISEESNDDKNCS